MLQHLVRHRRRVGSEFGVAKGPPRPDGGIPRKLKAPTCYLAALILSNGLIGIIAFKVMPALAAGCSIILKTSWEAPLSSLVFADVIAELTEEGIIPPGVISVLTADREVANTLITNPEVDHISFTGSTAAGRHMMTTAAERIAKVSLELGGKSAAIVLDDADLDEVMQSLPMGSLAQSGQACVALTRVLVSRKRHDELVEKLKGALSQLPMGDPWNPQNILGPLALERQRDSVESYIPSAKEQGAEC